MYGRLFQRVLVTLLTNLDLRIETTDSKQALGRIILSQQQKIVVVEAQPDLLLLFWLHHLKLGLYAIEALFLAQSRLKHLLDRWNFFTRLTDIQLQL